MRAAVPLERAVARPGGRQSGVDERAPALIGALAAAAVRGRPAGQLVTVRCTNALPSPLHWLKVPSSPARPQYPLSPKASSSYPRYRMVSWGTVRIVFRTPLSRTYPLVAPGMEIRP